MIEKLVATGEARINFSGHNGYTPLHFACANGHLECVSILLQLGADPSASTGKGRGYLTPLHIASQAGFDDIVSLLLHHSSDVLERDSCNNTATDVAATMAVSLKNEIEANRRRDCEVVLRVQDDPADLFKYFRPPKKIKSNIDIEKDSSFSSNKSLNSNKFFSETRIEKPKWDSMLLNLYYDSINNKSLYNLDD